MTDHHVTTVYDVHGVRTVVTSDQPQVSAALQARLRHFPRHAPGPVDLSFRFGGALDHDHHLVRRPQGRARPVYEPPLGEVVYVDETDQLYITYDERVRVLCDLGQGLARVSILPSAVDQLWVLSHPLFTLPFVELLKRRGRYSLHAAAVCVNGRGLLLPGPSGAGKSTLTLALVRAGWGFLGDDVCFLTQSPEGVRLLAFPDEIDVTEDTIRWFPELHAALQRPKAPGWPKRQVWAEAVYGVEVVWDCRPAALVFPRVAHTAESRLQPMDKAEAFLELVPNVLLTEARASQAHLEMLAALVSACACYRLETGRDVAALPRLLRDVLA